MCEQTPEQPYIRFVRAIAAGDDAQIETCCTQLTAAEETALIELAGSSSVEERWWAIRALAHCGLAPSAAVMASAFSAEQVELRQVAALAMGHLYERVPEAVAPHVAQLAALLADADGLVRQAAVTALALCGNDALAPLAQILADADHQGARTRAVQALRRMGTMGAAAILYRYLEDPNHLVRTYAYEALDEMGLLENILVTL